MKQLSFGEERKPYDWKDPQFGYTVEEVSFEDMERLLLEQAWSDTQQESLGG